ncbi:glycosyl hydrolase [Decorospora gaudefroyi]|uniref:Glycosyl hydrolase n=1 Tax=Decorospora gaudefroyi TaxID=184978 RepID=A0A6A5JZP5_9PLEO|nr:glycosyl hydrolase [Decorospora gaudefroyi]
MKYLAALLIPLLYSSHAFADFTDDALEAVRTLQNKWYNFDTGLWDNLWWQSANMIETIARFGLQDPDFKDTAINIISNTYNKSPNQLGYDNWKNDYYDDEGWWAMAWIASYDLTGDIKYLNSAKDLFEDMQGGWSTPCGGGIWWSKNREYIAAISNELFLSVGAHLANRVSGPEKEEYLTWAQAEWDWFKTSGVINADNLINDGIDPDTCQNNGKTTFTYNQGVVLAGLSEMARAKSDGGFVAWAYGIANAVLLRLVDPSGILTEPVESLSLDTTASQFKGAFVRGLSTLNRNEPQVSFREFLTRNANAAKSQPRVDGGVIVDRWQGGSGKGNAASHSSGIDVLVAAAMAG